MSMLNRVIIESDNLHRVYIPGESQYFNVGYDCGEITVFVECEDSVSAEICGQPVLPGEKITRKLYILDNPIEIKTTDMADGRAETVLLHINREPDGKMLYRERMRPAFHFTPYAGQMNDPNGLVYIPSTDEYHLFFQCNRAFDNGVEGLSGTTSWGHAVSKDMLKWKELPIAVTPDKWGMAWSGSSVIDRDNTSGLFDDTVPPESRLVCFYAAVGAGMEYGYCKECMVYSPDGGKTFIRYRDNPVVKNPGDMYGAGLRDPKVFRYENDELDDGWIWVMVTVGNLSIFTSRDLINWKFCGRPVDPDGNLFDSECPDLYPLAVDGDARNVKWVYTGGGIFYMLGHMEVTGKDEVMYIPETGKIYAVNGIADQGPGNPAPETYATQTFHNEKYGRRVSISWLRDPTLFVGDKIWNSAQSLPTEHTLHSVNGKIKLFSYPVDEVKSLRGQPVFSLENEIFDEKSANPLSDITADCCDIEADISLCGATEAVFEVRIGDTRGLIIRYSRGEEKLYVDKTQMGDCSYTGIYEPEMSLPDDGRITLRILLDRSCYDVYGNGGEAAVAGLILTDPDRGKMSFSVNGKVRVNSLKIYPMENGAQ